MNATWIDKAKDVLSQRKDIHGSPEDSFWRIANYWNVYLRDKPPGGLTVGDIAMMLVLFKIARESKQEHSDNVVDIIGYAQLYGRIRYGDE